MNSTELTQNPDPLNTTLPTLPNINTPLIRLQRQLVNLIRQLNSQNNQQPTNAPTLYYLSAASTQTPSPAVHRNTQKMYPYLGGSMPIQQSLRLFDGTDATYTTENFLNAITAKMVMTAGPKQTSHHIMKPEF